MEKSGTLLPVIVGWILGLITSAATQWIQVIRRRKNTATLLRQEVERNETYLKVVKAMEDAIDEEGRIQVEEGGVGNFENFKVTVADPSFAGGGGEPETTLFTATLNEQGTLNHETLKSLHTFYHHLQRAHEFRLTAHKEDLPSFFKQAADNAESAMQEIEANNLTERLKAEGSWNPLNRP